LARGLKWDRRAVPAKAELAINPCNANMPKPVEHCTSISRRVKIFRFLIIKILSAYCK
jgi:hypothetical protein